MTAIPDDTQQQTAVVAVEDARPPVAVAQHQLAQVQQLLHQVLVPGRHYGTIPGTQGEAALLKAGAELIATAFRVAPTYVIEDLSTEDAVRYRVTCRGVHQSSGVVLGDGVGECSSNETKYKWRGCGAREFEATPPERRRVKYARGDRGERELKQVRQEPADVANTVLKMASKRALVAMVLTVTAASDCFSAADDEGDVAGAAEPARRQRAPTPEAAATIDAGQIRLVRRLLESGGIDDADFCLAFQVGCVEELGRDRINDALAWIRERDA